ncbi:MAG: ATP-binding protein [Bacteroidales bacterium]|nr:ATP-binding protein [Bacteroidales bacterium]
MIPRILKKKIAKALKPGKVIGLFGARRTGKTIIMEEIKKEIKGKKVLMVSGENLDAAEILSSQRLGVLKKFVQGYTYLFIDEAQKITNIGLNLKLIADNIAGIYIFVTGSSAFELKNKLSEPLTGRSRFYYLYPIAQKELKEDMLQAKEHLESRLIFGSYPQVINAKNDNERKEVLESIKNGFLLKDILELDKLKNSLFILNLLRLIAFQIGNDISYTELASKLNVNKKTVMRYFDLLEKCYIIFSLQGFSRNLRKEYARTPRYYFWDNGIRNSLISNFNSLSLRDDTGKLWENYCISERLKKTHYDEMFVNHYFWRTYDQQEIDLIEEGDGNLSAYEFKWSETKSKAPKSFLDNYERSTYSVINRMNYLDFIT